MTESVTYHSKLTSFQTFENTSRDSGWNLRHIVCPYLMFEIGFKMIFFHPIYYSGRDGHSQIPIQMLLGIRQLTKWTPAPITLVLRAQTTSPDLPRECSDNRSFFCQLGLWLSDDDCSQCKHWWGLHFYSNSQQISYYFRLDDYTALSWNPVIDNNRIPQIHIITLLIWDPCENLALWLLIACVIDLS